MPDTSVAALPQSAAASSTQSLRPLGRPVKMVLFAGIGLAGSYGLFSEGAYISTSDSVVSAYVVEVRAPIEGTLSGLPLAAGALVHQADVLARIENPLADRQHLDNLNAEAEAAEAAAESLRREQGELAGQRHSLLRQAALHDGAVTTRFAAQVAEAERLAASQELALAQAETDLRRGEQLHHDGIISNADYERLRSTRQIAEAQTAAARASLASLREQARAAAHGVMAEPGQNMDVSYSRQRADEIAMRMAENQRTLESSLAQAAFIRASAATESARAAGLHKAELRSPLSGMLWDLNATDGERAGAGDTLLTLVDCSRQFVLARIPQDRVPDVALHATARFRLAGETVDRTGNVLSISGEGKKISAHKLAAEPDAAEEKHEALATVLIAPDASPQGPCMIGRTARVLIPTVPSTLASRWTREHL